MCRSLVLISMERFIGLIYKRLREMLLLLLLSREVEKKQQRNKTIPTDMHAHTHMQTHTRFFAAYRFQTQYLMDSCVCMCMCLCLYMRWDFSRSRFKCVRMSLNFPKQNNVLVMHASAYHFGCYFIFWPI